MITGIIAINKPVGPTSNDIVQQVKKITGQKVGHAGTLDPLASGVLVLGIGREATKKLSEVVKKEKEYVAEIFLGANSTTDDQEGEKTIVEAKNQPTEEQIVLILKEFVGQIQQTPPVYSAIKIKGQEAYKLARKGRSVDLKSRPVEIKQIELLKYNYPLLKIKVVSGPGVYIRSLARDIGKKLGSGGYLFSLVRTRVGQYKIEQAKTVEELKSHANL
ncbi:MAG: tRNA pseudouridine(55) synthase TruB [Candidatus Buchananbacteria bacterium]|nr:tRNA pseudouridine(55) synthase TruB [Candidatus Buchananbacteria bacterium]